MSSESSSIFSCSYKLKTNVLPFQLIASVHRKEIDFYEDSVHRKNCVKITWYRKNNHVTNPGTKVNKCSVPTNPEWQLRLFRLWRIFGPVCRDNRATVHWHSNDRELQRGCVMFRQVAPCAAGIAVQKCNLTRREYYLCYTNLHRAVPQRVFANGCRGTNSSLLTPWRWRLYTVTQCWPQPDHNDLVTILIYCSRTRMSCSAEYVLSLTYICSTNRRWGRGRTELSW